MFNFGHDGVFIAVSKKVNIIEGFYDRVRGIYNADCEESRIRISHYLPESIRSHSTSIICLGFEVKYSLGIYRMDMHDCQFISIHWALFVEWNELRQ